MKGPYLATTVTFTGHQEKKKEEGSRLRVAVERDIGPIEYLLLF